MSKQAVRALKAFNRNLDGAMVVGHPKHPDVNGRVMLLSTEAANELVRSKDAEPISRKVYDDELRKAAGDEDFVASPRESQTGVPAGEVRKLTTQAADGSRATGAGVANNKRASVTMSTEALRAMAEERGVDLTGARSRGDMAKRINGTGGKPQETDVTQRGTIGNLTDGSTNHDPASSPHKPANAQGSTTDLPSIPGGEDTGIETAEDAAPTGGGGSGGE